MKKRFLTREEILATPDEPRDSPARQFADKKLIQQISRIRSDLNAWLQPLLAASRIRDRIIAKSPARYFGPHNLSYHIAVFLFFNDATDQEREASAQWLAEKIWPSNAQRMQQSKAVILALGDSSIVQAIRLGRHWVRTAEGKKRLIRPFDLSARVYDRWFIQEAHGVYKQLLRDQAMQVKGARRAEPGIIDLLRNPNPLESIIAAENLDRIRKFINSPKYSRKERAFLNSLLSIFEEEPTIQAQEATHRAAQILGHTPGYKDTLISRLRKKSQRKL